MPKAMQFTCHNVDLRISEGWTVYSVHRRNGLNERVSVLRELERRQECHEHGSVQGRGWFQSLGRKASLGLEPSISWCIGIWWLDSGHVGQFSTSDSLGLIPSSESSSMQTLKTLSGLSVYTIPSVHLKYWGTGPLFSTPVPLIGKERNSLHLSLWAGGEYSCIHLPSRERVEKTLLSSLP